MELTTPIPESVEANTTPISESVETNTTPIPESVETNTIPIFESKPTPISETFPEPPKIPISEPTRDNSAVPPISESKYDVDDISEFSQILLGLDRPPKYHQLNELVWVKTEDTYWPALVNFPRNFTEISQTIPISSASPHFLKRREDHKQIVKLFGYKDNW
jgi:hypothetical protein